MLGVSLKVIHPALINCKSFLLNAKKVSIQYCFQGFWHGTYILDLIFTNLGMEALIVEIKKGPRDLSLTILHIFLLRVYVEVRVVLSFFSRFFLDYFQLGFLSGWFTSKGLENLILDI